MSKDRITKMPFFGLTININSDRNTLNFYGSAMDSFMVENAVKEFIPIISSRHAGLGKWEIIVDTKNTLAAEMKLIQILINEKRISLGKDAVWV